MGPPLCGKGLNDLGPPDAGGPPAGDEDGLVLQAGIGGELSHGGGLVAVWISLVIQATAQEPQTQWRILVLCPFSQQQGKDEDRAQ